MVGGIKRNIIEKEQIDYRGVVGAINQSMLKVYDSDPSDFYRQFCLRESKDEKDTFATLVGTVAEFLLLECKCDELEFENKAGDLFALYQGNKGGGQGYLLADYLFEEVSRGWNPEYPLVIDNLEVAFRIAFDRCQAEDKYKKKTVEWAFEDFQKRGKDGASAEDYFNFKVSNIGKKVIDNNVINKSREVAQMLKTDEFTRDLFDFDSDENSFSQRLVKFPILWKYGNLDCKMEMDQAWLNQMDGYAIIDDLKCVYDNESFDYSYIKYGYYIQNAFYFLGFRWWLDNNGMKDVSIKHGMRFIVGDTSKNKRRPLIYHTDLEDVLKGLNGFKLRGIQYKGVDQLMKEVEWAMEEGIFNCSFDSFEKRGQIKLNIQYEN